MKLITSLSLLVLMGQHTKPSPHFYLKQAVYDWHGEFHRPLAFISSQTLITTSEEVWLAAWKFSYSMSSCKADLLRLAARNLDKDEIIERVVVCQDKGFFATIGTKTRLWDAASLQIKFTFAKKGDIGTFSPDGKRLAVYDQRQGLTIYQVDSGQPSASLKSSEEIISLAFTQDSKNVLLQPYNGKLLSWSLASTKVIPQAQMPVIKSEVVVFSPDCKWLAFAQGHTLHLFDLVKKVETVIQEDSTINAVAFSTDNSILVLGTDGIARVCNTKTWLITHTIDYGACVLEVVISPDGKSLVTEYNDKTISLWKLLP